MTGIEIVKCRDCCHFHTTFIHNIDNVTSIAAYDVCDNWGGGCRTAPEGFCFKGERSEKSE